MLRQSLNFFQNDFAGRIAQRIMQTGNSLRDSAVQLVDAIWHVVIYAVTSLVLFAEADWRLMIPLIIWIVAYSLSLRFFVPRVKQRSVVSSEARSKLMGTIVDGYTNIATLKLFAHNDLEKRYARDAIQEQTDKTQHASRMVTSMDITLSTLNGLLIVSTSGLALWLWSQSLISVGAIALATGLVIRGEHVRLDHVGGERHLRKHRHGAGWPEHHCATAQRAGCRRRKAAGDAWPDPL